MQVFTSRDVLATCSVGDFSLPAFFRGHSQLIPADKSEWSGFYTGTVKSPPPNNPNFPRPQRPRDIRRLAVVTDHELTRDDQRQFQ
jgi:hypothetical protein